MKTNGTATNLPVIDEGTQGEEGSVTVPLLPSEAIEGTPIPLKVFALSLLREGARVYTSLPKFAEQLDLSLSHFADKRAGRKIIHAHELLELLTERDSAEWLINRLAEYAGVDLRTSPRVTPRKAAALGISMVTQGPLRRSFRMELMDQHRGLTEKQADELMDCALRELRGEE